MHPKQAMTAFDLRAVVPELADLAGAKVNKAYQPSRNEVSLNLWLPGSGRQDLHVRVGGAGDRGGGGPGGYAVRTRYARDNPTQPPAFAMQLRKHVGGATVTGVHQMGMDRLLVVDMEAHAGDRSLILELFGEGNAVLTEPAGILAALRFQEFAHRTVRPGLEYVPPPMRGDPLARGEDEVLDVLAGSERDLVRCVAVDLDVGSLADEVVHRSGLDKATAAAEVADDDGAVQALLTALEEVLGPFRTGDYDPRVYRDPERDGRAVHVAPIPLLHLEAEGLSAEPYASVNEAFDDYFSRELRKHVETAKEQAVDARMEKIDTRIRHQRDGIARLKEEAKAEHAVAEAIYQNYQRVAAVLEAFADLRGVALTERFEARADVLDDAGTAEAVVDVRPDEAVVVVEIVDADGRTLEADLRTTASVEENASWHYDLAGKAKGKAKRAGEALQDSLAEKGRLEREGVEAVEARPEVSERESERRFWFEDYRWCLASTGHILVGGRDASTNERVVKKYLEAGDRFAHAEVHGAPAIVVKANEGEDAPPEAALEEAVAFTVAYSRAWRQGAGSGEGYWVLPEQVSKTPQTGEHVPKGAFIVRGKRHHATAPMRAAVGRVELEGVPKVMGGPVEAVKHHADRYVVLEPGTEPTNAAAGRLARALDADVEDVQKALPPGPVRVVEAVGVPFEDVAGEGAAGGAGEGAGGVAAGGAGEGAGDRSGKGGGDAGEPGGSGTGDGKGGGDAGGGSR